MTERWWMDDPEQGSDLKREPVQLWEGEWYVPATMRLTLELIHPELGAISATADVLFANYKVAKVYGPVSFTVGGQAPTGPMPHDMQNWLMAQFEAHALTP